MRSKRVRVEEDLLSSRNPQTFLLEMGAVTKLPLWPKIFSRSGLLISFKEEWLRQQVLLA